MKTLSRLITEVNLLDRVTIKVPAKMKSTYLGIAKDFDGAKGSIIGVEKDGSTKMFRVKFDKPIMINDVGEVSSDLFPADWLKKGLHEGKDTMWDITVTYTVVEKASKKSPEVKKKEVFKSFGQAATAEKMKKHMEREWWPDKRDQIEGGNSEFRYTGFADTKPSWPQKWVSGEPKIEITPR